MLIEPGVAQIAAYYQEIWDAPSSLDPFSAPANDIICRSFWEGYDKCSTRLRIKLG